MGTLFLKTIALKSKLARFCLFVSYVIEPVATICMRPRKLMSQISKCQNELCAMIYLFFSIGMRLKYYFRWRFY